MHASDQHILCCVVLYCIVFQILYFFAGSVHFRIPESSPAGTVIGSVKASDADIGRNAELEYRIVDGDGRDMFDIITQKDTQEGVITVRKVCIIKILFIIYLFKIFVSCLSP